MSLDRRLSRILNSCQVSHRGQGRAVLRAVWEVPVCPLQFIVLEGWWPGKDHREGYSFLLLPMLSPPLWLNILLLGLTNNWSSLKLSSGISSSVKTSLPPELSWHLPSLKPLYFIMRQIQIHTLDLFTYFFLLKSTLYLLFFISITQHNIWHIMVFGCTE